MAEVVLEIANEKKCSPAQVALAWVLAQGPDIVPIPGTKRRPYLEENLGSLKVGLAADDLRRLEAAFPVGAAPGNRYQDRGMLAVNR